MTILVNPEDHREIREVIMQLREEDIHRLPITHSSVPSPVAASMPQEGSKIELAMKTNSKDITHGTYLDFTKVPPTMDLFTIIPDRTYRKGETQLANGRTVAQLIVGGRAEIGDAVITSPIKTVAQAERG